MVAPGALWRRWKLWTLAAVRASAMALLVCGCSWPSGAGERREASPAGPDSDLDGLDPEVLEARERVPVHPWHRERVANIRRENVEEVIENLANFDDNHFATTAAGASILGNARSEMIRLTHLFRVRRLMELGRAAPKAVGAKLAQSLRRGLAAWPDAFHEERKVYDRANGEPCQFKPTAHDQIRTRVTACTYLLAELGNPSHLPLLLASYRAQAKWIAQIPEEHYRHIPQTPVPPSIALYAMHRVIASLPQDKLGPRERAARETYMAWASRHLPPAKEIEVSSWNADYDESDPRVRFMDPDGTVLRGQRTIRMVVYPHSFVDGTPMQKYPAAPYLPERVQEWAESLCALAELIVGDKQETLSVGDLKTP